MKRKFVAPVACLLLLTFGLLAWQSARLSSYLKLPGKVLLGKVGGDAHTLPTNYLSTAERNVLDELNLARTDPRRYATLLEEARKTLSGSQIKLGGAKTVTLKEGASAVDEAIKFLREVKPLPPLEISKGMCLGAKDHIKDMLSNGSTGHKGTDGSLPEQRVSRYGNWQLALGENIAYASSTAREAVLGMIIDDGVPGRGHRLNLFNTNHRVAGIAAAQRSSDVATCVVTYAGGFVEKSEGASAAKMF
ncbi:MAG: hypothetical protein QOD32_2652 [Pyrinomonadaceae bacterium]|jgi:uncharacterized protein YkwD|nr:hypothetical protein [Pyrinomonadaceae bacterium]